MPGVSTGGREEDVKHATWFMAVLLFSITATASEGNRMPRALDLASDSDIARKSAVPMLVLVSTSDCIYCIQLKKQILGPLLKSGLYKDRLVVRELFIDEGEQVIDFSGTRRAASAVAEDYKARLTPTLLFLAPGGSRLLKNMVGFYTPDMYGYYLEQNIETAIAAMKQLDSP